MMLSPHPPVISLLNSIKHNTFRISFPRIKYTISIFRVFGYIFPQTYILIITKFLFLHLYAKLLII
jgi:hypothetical protein